MPRAQGMVVLPMLVPIPAAGAADWKRQLDRTAVRQADGTAAGTEVVVLDALEVRPVAGNTVVAAQLRQGTPRVGDELTTALQSKRDLLSAYYRWAGSTKKQTVEALVVSLDIDPWGVVSDVSVAPSSARLPGLAECVADALLHATLDPGCGSSFR